VIVADRRRTRQAGALAGEYDGRVAPPTDPFDFAAFIARLEQRLAQPLPGLPAQLAMAPRPRSAPRPPFHPENAVPAAVLALLFPDGTDGGAPLLTLTRRTEHVASHKGQVCLPGGVLDDGETPTDAALRELREEIGVPAHDVRILGPLTPVFIPVTGYRMQPFVAVAPRRPDFVLATIEVDELIEAPLRQLLDPGARGERPLLRPGFSSPATIPFFTLLGHEVWGATAMVLAELAVVARDAGIDAGGTGRGR
jgi:8-oxo-dGTP pyrophosphatase MutT (NUDIX family)